LTTDCELTTAGEPACDQPAVVAIHDRYDGSRAGCRVHGVRALRAIEGARVVPLPGQDGEAIAVYNAANRASGGGGGR
jgi:hypothetical protein